MERRSENIELIRWCMSVGVSAAHAAELTSHIDIARCKSAGLLWRFAGLEVPEKSPTAFNAKLKLVCLEIGERFAKTTETGFGAIYQQRVYSEFRNSRSKRTIEHLHASARRYTVKRFLAAYHEVAWWLRFRHLPPAPYPQEIPNILLIRGLSEARTVHAA